MKHHLPVGLLLAGAIYLLVGCGSAPGSASSNAQADTANRSGASPMDGAVFEFDCVPTQLGQNVYVVGDIPELGSWDPNAAVPLSGMFGCNDVTCSPKLFAYSWQGTVKIALGTTFHFKFIIKNPDGSVIWQSGPNRHETLCYTAQTCGAIGDPVNPGTALSYSFNNYYSAYGDYWTDSRACNVDYWNVVQYLNSNNSGA
jgi:hypothetical protein